MKRKRRVFLSVLGVLILAVGFYAYRQYSRKVTPLDQVRADLSINATDLISAFETDEEKANSRFLKKEDFIIAVEGTVKEVTKDESGNVTVVLGDQGTLSSVRCSMDAGYQEKALSLQTGDRVVVKGNCTGFNADELLGSDVILNRAVIDKKN